MIFSLEIFNWTIKKMILPVSQKKILIKCKLWLNKMINHKILKNHFPHNKIWKLKKTIKLIINSRFQIWTRLDQWTIPRTINKILKIISICQAKTKILIIKKHNYIQYKILSLAIQNISGHYPLPSKENRIKTIMKTIIYR